jgi:hypothetical protein
MDGEGDMISISSQDDLEEAIECMEESQPCLKLVLEEDIEKARQCFEKLGSVMFDTMRINQMPRQMKPEEELK